MSRPPDRTVRIARRHRWNLSVEAALRLQERLAAAVDTRRRLGPIRLVAGADAAYTADAGRLVAAVVVVASPALDTVDEAWAEGPVTFPYVPGLFGFRKAPVVLRACANLRRRPDVLLCDGHGIAHPRRFGLACHVGWCLDLPTVGCAKTPLVGEHDRIGTRRGARAWLRDRGERIGIVLRTADGVRPVFVSPGFAIGFRDAASVVLRTTTGYRLPEPIRRANHLVNVLRRGAEAVRR